MELFDIFIAYISWGSVGKRRPVLVFSQGDDTVEVFQITTQYERKSKAIRVKYLKINDWRLSGLDKLSYIDTNNIVELPTAVFDTKTPIGQLTRKDRLRLREFINK